MMLDFNGNTLRPSLLGALRKLAFGPMFGGAKPSFKLWNDTIESAKVTLEKFAGTFEGKFVAGNSITIADIQSFFEISLFTLMLKFDLHQIPKVHEWYNKVSESHYVHNELENYKLFVHSSVGDKLPEAPKEEVFDFYHTPLSQPSAAVKTLLDISGAKYNVHIINLL